MKELLYRLIRITITLIIVTITIGLTICFPIPMSIVLLSLIALFTLTSLPYYVIGYIFLKISKAAYVCVTLPFASRFITIKDKEFKGTIDSKIIAHENDHIAYFKEKTPLLGSIIYILYTIWFGYYNNPIEVRARKAKAKPVKCRVNDLLQK